MRIEMVGCTVKAWAFMITLSAVCALQTVSPSYGQTMSVVWGSSDRRTESVARRTLSSGRGLRAMDGSSTIGTPGLYPNMPEPYDDYGQGGGMVSGTFWIGFYTVWSGSKDPKGLKLSQIKVYGTPQSPNTNSGPFMLENRSWTPSASNPVYYWEGEFLIDSTAFADFSIIDIQSVLQSASSATPTIQHFKFGVDNAAFLLSNVNLPGTGSESGIVSRIMSPTYISNGDFYEAKPDIIRDMSYYSIAVLNTHGADDAFGDSYATQDGNDLAHWLSDDTDVNANGTTDTNDIGQLMSNKVNSSMWPPFFTFVDADACNTAGTPGAISNNLSEALGIRMMGNQSNQGFLGWDRLIAVGRGSWQPTVNYQRVLWTLLMQGHTLQEAKALAKSQGAWTYSPNSDNPIDPRYSEDSNPVLFGDADMRVHGLYTSAKQGAVVGPWSVYDVLYDGPNTNPSGGEPLQ